MQRDIAAVHYIATFCTLQEPQITTQTTRRRHAAMHCKRAARVIDSWSSVCGDLWLLERAKRGYVVHWGNVPLHPS